MPRLLPPSLVLVALSIAGHAWCADEAQPAKATSASVPALAASLKTNLDYCQQWFDGQDYKTLAQTAAGVTIVADTLARKSDESTAAACKSIIESSDALASAARKKDAAASGKELAALRQKITALKPAAAAAPAANLKAPAGSMRAMMDLLEGTMGDAKTGAAVGDLPAAKQSAQVLAELGEVLSNYKSDARWKGWSDEFTQHSRAVATSEATDAAKIKSLLKEVSLSCEKCHKKR